MEVYAPWGMFTAAVAAAMIYLQLLPEVFARRRIGMGRWADRWLLWPCLLAILALFAWPFIAAGAIDWGRRAPTVWSIVLMTLGALALAWVAQMAAGAVIGAIGAGAQSDEDAVEVLQLLRAFDTGVVMVLLVATVVAYWFVGYDGQEMLCGRYGC